MREPATDRLITPGRHSGAHAAVAELVIEDDRTRRPLTTLTGRDPDEALTLAVLEMERRSGGSRERRRRIDAT